MRIIAGEFRGRRLLPPEGDTTRPITDRVKQSLFDILTPLIPDATVYDCFAGTGSMGLECLSRGAAFATFFEADRSAGKRLEKNIATLGVADRSTVVDRDLFKWFENSGEAKERAGIVFLDPPYRMVREEPERLRAVVEAMRAKHLSPAGLIVFRHEARDRLEFERFVVEQRTYGGMTINFLRAG